MFLLFFPFKYFKEVILPSTNVILLSKSQSPTDLGELVKFLGVWLFLATMGGFKRSDFWSSSEINIRDGAPYRLHEIISGRRFEQLCSALGYTNEPPPNYVDKFWEVRQMIGAWNKNINDQFSASWVSCLDESMSIWHSRYTCPGWMFVPRKPHPFGNEYHSICCALSGIMFGIELVEGKSSPPERPRDINETQGKTVALLLRLCKPLYATGKVVILDSGFCVVKALIWLRIRGVFAAAVIKKRRYWPRYIKGDEINAHMEDKEVGECDCMRGNMDRIKYNVFCLKEPNYVMKIMSTYGGLIDPPRQRKDAIRTLLDGSTITYKYTEPFANHFDYRHCVDDHNNLRHQTPALEETWITYRWPTRVFTFLLAISEVNAYLAFRYFVWNGEKKLNFHTFRKQLAFGLMYNDWVGPEQPYERSMRSTARRTLHEIHTAPLFARSYNGRKWLCTAKGKYQQYVCRGANCKKPVRTYCRCNPGNWLCTSCHLLHVVVSLRGSESEH